MKAKEEKKHSRKSVIKIVVIVAISALAVYCAFAFISNLSDINRLKAQSETAQEQLDKQLEENDSLKAILDSDNKDEYIEQKAREKGYVKDGEVVYYDIASSK